MGTKRPNGSLYVDNKGPVAHVEFGHPAGNSFTMELLDRLEGELLKIARDPNVHTILLKSEGNKAFCGGASFDELLAITNLEEGERFFGGFARVINAMRSCGKIVVGRVQGKAVGGGVGLISACDLVFATEDSSIKLSELAIGIAPLVIEPAVTRKIGPSGFAELALQPTTWKNAYWAREKGLFNAVYDNIREMDKELDHYLVRAASHSPEAVLEVKQALWQGTDHWDELLARRAALSGQLALLSSTKEKLNALKK